MNEINLIPVVYAVFMWLVILHTFEEISCGIFELKIGKISMARNKYLLVASGISTVNITVLILLILEIPLGLYLGLFTTTVLGVFQGIVHTYGYFSEAKKAQGIGAGFYSSIPLAIYGLGAFILILQSILY